MKTAKVDGGLTPEAAVLWRVISTVFIHVVKPAQDIVRNEHAHATGRKTQEFD